MPIDQLHIVAVVVTKTYPSAFTIACIIFILIHKSIALLFFPPLRPYQTITPTNPNVDSSIGTLIIVFASIIVQIDLAKPSYLVTFTIVGLYQISSSL